VRLPVRFKIINPVKVDGTLCAELLASSLTFLIKIG